MASSGRDKPAIADAHLEIVKQLLAHFDAWLQLGEVEPLIITPITGGYSSAMYKVGLPPCVLDGKAFAALSPPRSVVARIYSLVGPQRAESLQRPSRELAGMGIVSHVYVCRDDAHLEEFIDGSATGTCCGPEPFTLSKDVTIGTAVSLAKLHRELTPRWKDHAGTQRMSVETSWASGARIIGPHPLEEYMKMSPAASVIPSAWRDSDNPRLDVPLVWAVELMETRAEACSAVEGWTLEAVQKASEVVHKCAQQCCDFPTALCHQDAHAANVMQRQDGSLVLVDLETIDFNFAAYDVAVVIVRRGLESGNADVVPDEAFLRDVVAAYLNENPVATPDAFLDQVRLCCVLAWWTKIIWSFIASVFMGMDIPMVRAIPSELKGLHAYASSLL